MTLSRLLLVLSFVLFVLLGLWGAGWLITTDHAFAFLGFGLASFVLAGLVA